MTPPVPMPQVLCPNCTQQGYLEIYPSEQALNCRLCRWFVLGHRDGNDLVFPDPHVKAGRL